MAMTKLRLVWQRWALTALVTLFGVELIRLLFPTFVFYLRDAQGFSAISLAPIAIGIFALSFLAWPLSKLDIPLALILTAGGVALFRVLVQLFSSPAGNLFFGAVGVVLFLMYLPLALSHALARKGGTVNFGLALLLGLTLSTAVHSALWTYDLIWRQGFIPLVVVILLALLILAALRKHFNDNSHPETIDLSWRQALPFATLGPWLFLQLVVFQNVARFAAVSGWSLPAAGAMMTIGNLAGLWLALLIIRRGSGGLVSVIIMGLLVVASLIFSETAAFPANFAPFVGQVLSSGLLMVLLVHLGEGTQAAAIGRLGVSNGIGMLLLVILSFVYYVSYDISLGFNATIVLPMAGILVVFGILAPSRNQSPVTAPEPGNVPIIIGGVLLLFPLITWLNWQSLEVADTPDNTHIPVVINFNLHNGFDSGGQLDLEAIAQVIEDSGADIVGLQEVSRGWVINGSSDMAQWLSQRLSMPYIFGPTEGALWGNMLLSRYPIIQASNFALGPDSLLLRRGYIEAEIDTGQQVLQVTVTHLHHREDGSDIRQAQVAELLDGRSNTVGLIMGDFNATPDTPEMALINQAGWVDVLSTVEPPASHTYPADQPSRQIDYIWVSADLAFSEPVVLQTLASDHLPIVAQLGE